MQIGIGFGNIVHSDPEESELPTMLGYTAPRLLCYSRESAIAEKFKAMVKLGILNSRMKDFYDIWLLSRQYDFDGSQLLQAIHLTFDHRGTSLAEEIVAFQAVFIAEKQIQWTAFSRRPDQEHLPKLFAEIVTQLESFLGLLVAVKNSGKPLDKVWRPVDGWR